ncbi:beta-ketoacyl synthase N-terminal-like domain-containing protein [Kribbella sp. NPDC056951]|uniref:beta-ketoacyl synthase N-terminal-like domain-containing protein n=1 Tax=Kribbella sp. NPDC056951 TaxID=3345978 RepID=UPI003631F17A
MIEVHDLVVLAEARWPEPGDGVPSGIPGFVESAFNPLAAAAAERCLERAGRPAGATGVVVVTAGDRVSAAAVQELVAQGKRVGPLFFFQSVPNSIAGWIAAKWDLRGPVVCVTDGGFDEAALLIGDGDADRVLIVQVAADEASAQIVSGGESV